MCCASATPSGSTLEFCKGFYAVAFKDFSALEVCKFNDEQTAFDNPAGLFNQCGGCLGGTSGGEQVIDDDNLLPRFYGVLVDFHAGVAIFKVVRNLDSFAGEFAFFAHGNERLVEVLCYRNSEKEPACF